MSSQQRANGGESSTSEWSLVIPLKPAAVGKSRLGPFAGAHRRALARAMALDTVCAAVSCPAVAEVAAVTNDEELVAELTELGAIVVMGAPGDGLNSALRHGARTLRTRHGGGRVAAMLGDLPALQPYELT